jgi:hypothetical protein
MLHLSSALSSSYQCQTQRASVALCLKPQGAVQTYWQRVQQSSAFLGFDVSELLTRIIAMLLTKVRRIRVRNVFQESVRMLQITLVETNPHWQDCVFWCTRMLVPSDRQCMSLLMDCMCSQWRASAQTAEAEQQQI